MRFLAALGILLLGVALACLAAYKPRAVGRRPADLAPLPKAPPVKPCPPPNRPRPRP